MMILCFDTASFGHSRLRDFHIETPLLLSSGRLHDAYSRLPAYCLRFLEARFAAPLPSPRLKSPVDQVQKRQLTF